MNYLLLLVGCVWVLALSLIGIAAAERREWRVFGMAVVLLVATLLAVLAARVMAA